MDALLRFLVEHGPVLLAGITVLLALGALFMLCQRPPVHRQRVGEMTVLAALVWLILTCVPLPRLSPEPKRAVPVAVEEVRREAPTTITAEMVALEPVSPSAAPPLSVKPEMIMRASEPAAGIIEAPATGSPPIFAVVTEARSPFDWRRAAARVYLVGVAACAGWLLLGHALLRRLIRRARRPERWLSGLFEELNPPHSCRLLVSPAASRPMSCGMFRPVIVLPAPCAMPEQEHQLQQVLRHELAHVAQRDAIGHALFNLALPLLYFQPLYWLIRARTFLARELVADDRAASQGGSKASYVRELIALAAQRQSLRRGGLNVIGIFESTTHFYRRMHMLLQRQNPLATRCSTWWRLTAASAAALVLTASTLFVGVNSAEAQPASTVARDEEVAALRKERDALSARLAAMEEQLAELRAQMTKLRASSVAKTARSQDRAEVEALDDPLVGPAKRKQAQNQVATVEATTARSLDDKIRAEVAQKRAIEQQMRQQQLAAVEKQKVQQQQQQDGRLPGYKASQFDLINLANSYIEASGNRKLQRIDYQRIERLAKDNAVSQAELDKAAVELEMAERKMQLFRGMAEAALRSAQAEYENAKRLTDKGYLPSSALHEAESRIRILELILSN